MAPGADVDDGQVVVAVDEVGNHTVELGIGMGFLLDRGRQTIADGNIPTDETIESGGAGHRHELSVASRRGFHAVR